MTTRLAKTQTSKRWPIVTPVDITEEDIARFWAKVALPDARGCLVWTGPGSGTGYGKFRRFRRSVFAHRFAYMALVGPIADGLVLDHLCRNRACVRPDHLDAVTQRVNVLRGESPAACHAVATHCPATPTTRSTRSSANAVAVSAGPATVTRSGPAAPRTVTQSTPAIGQHESPRPSGTATQLQ
jgi:hypothetical protein